MLLLAYSVFLVVAFSCPALEPVKDVTLNTLERCRIGGERRRGALATSPGCDEAPPLARRSVAGGRARAPVAVAATVPPRANAASNITTRHTIRELAPPVPILGLDHGRSAVQRPIHRKYHNTILTTSPYDDLPSQFVHNTVCIIDSDSLNCYIRCACSQLRR